MALRCIRQFRRSGTRASVKTLLWPGPWRITLRRSSRITESPHQRTSFGEAQTITIASIVVYWLCVLSNDFIVLGYEPGMSRYSRWHRQSWFVNLLDVGRFCRFWTDLLRCVLINPLYLSLCFPPFIPAEFYVILNFMQSTIPILKCRARLSTGKPFWQYPSGFYENHT